MQIKIIQNLFGKKLKIYKQKIKLNNLFELIKEVKYHKMACLIGKKILGHNLFSLNHFFKGLLDL